VINLLVPRFYKGWHVQCLIHGKLYKQPVQDGSIGFRYNSMG
jgi:hypothetical protein